MSDPTPDTLPERIYVKPALMNGAPMQVRKPIGGRLQPEGEWVNQDSYWARRLLDRDVALATPPAAAPAAKTIK